MQSKPPQRHAKPIFACLAMVGFSLGFSWAVPFIHVNCTRNGELVDCVVQQRLLGLIAFDTTTIRDLRTVSLVIEDGTFAESGHINTTDTACLVLADATGVAKKFILESGQKADMTRSRKLSDQVETFLGSKESRLSAWTVPLLGYGPFLPAIVGLLLLSLVLLDFLGTRFRSRRIV